MYDYKMLLENLGKLKRNEEQMTPEQKKRFLKPLIKLKTEIAAEATKYIHSFAISGIKIADRDPANEDLYEEIRKIVKKAQEDGLYNEFSKILFTEYDLDTLIRAALPLRYAIWYKAYGPYWITHCSRTGDKDFPFRNDLIGMEWSAKEGVWMNTITENGKMTADPSGSFATMLPPTQELIAAAYEKDMAEATS